MVGYSGDERTRKRGKVNSYLKWSMLLLMMPATVVATEQAPAVKVVREEKRFIPLDRASATRSSAGIALAGEGGEKQQPYVLTSDKARMRDGFMRIDRARTIPISSVSSRAKSPLLLDIPAATPPGASASAPAAPTDEVATNDASPEPLNLDDLDRESDEIEGNTDRINPVLALFDTGGEAPLASFTDTMRGRLGKTIAGLTRHALWPIPLNARQYVSSRYGVRKDPFHGRPTFHGGIDIAADTGTPVVATADASVTEVKTDSRYGQYITLRHADGTLTRYGHLSKQTVAVGERVRAGQTIGAVGSTGRSTGAHLDYRVSKDGVKYDPLSILSIPRQVADRSPATTATLAGITLPQKEPVALTRSRHNGVTVVRGDGQVTHPTPRRAMVIEVQ